jgi:hypothetical protein
MTDQKLNKAAEKMCAGIIPNWNSAVHKDIFYACFLAGTQWEAQQMKELVDALEFYADIKNQKAKVSYISLPTGQIHHVTSNYEEDAGERARQALKKYRGDE